jgi:hypothetical protein
MTNRWEPISGPVGRVMEKVEAPRIAAIPTKYAGVQFDKMGFQWSYEPIDFNGWTPDFLLRPNIRDQDHDVYAEVKPVFAPDPDDRLYEKAAKHWQSMWVLLLGAAPMDHMVGRLMDPPEDDRGVDWSDMQGTLSGWNVSDWTRHADMQQFWREAGNRVQWRAPEFSR